MTERIDLDYKSLPVTDPHVGIAPERKLVVLSTNPSTHALHLAEKERAERIRINKLTAKVEGWIRDQRSIRMGEQADLVTQQLTLKIPNAIIPGMQDRYRPTDAQIRTQAQKTIVNLDILEATHGAVGDLTAKAADPKKGAHTNLVLAREIANLTFGLRDLTTDSLTLARLDTVTEVPSVGIVYTSSLATAVRLNTYENRLVLDDERIERIYSGRFDVPKRVVLLNRFGLQTPAELIGKARSEAEKEARRGITIFSRFTGRNR